jgi:outer membrane protein assembly factor BamB
MNRVVQFGALAVSAMLHLSGVARADWPQWGGSPARNNVSNVFNLPADWQPGEFDRRTGWWVRSKAKNVKWVSRLGTQTYSSPVIAGGRILVGTNNANGYLKRYPAEVDLGCLLCFRERDGGFLWQFSAEKLPTGRAHDWPLQGIASTPLVEGDRAWFVSNRGEVVCVDMQGFYDDEDDGPVVGEYVSVATIPPRIPIAPVNPSLVAPLVARLDRGEIPPELPVQLQKVGEELPENTSLSIDEPGSRWSFTVEEAQSSREFLLRVEGELRCYKRQTTADKHEADVVWRFDMMERLGSRQHNLATCSITAWGDTLFVNSSNGVDEQHTTVPAPQAPSFFALNKRTGQVLWTSNLPGANILHGQWSAPAVGVLGGVPQVIFGGGDGWVYSFHAERWSGQQPQLLWKFDTNAKDARLELGGRGTRNEPFAMPVIYDNKVYITTGQDPEHGEGTGCIWCIDPTRKLDGSDVSPHKVINRLGQVIPPRRATNYVAQQETQLWSASKLEQDLDAGTLGKYLLANLKNHTQLPPADWAVKVLVPGAQWELTAGSGDAQETMYVWRRPRVNEFGEQEELYFLSRRTGERIVDNPDSAVVWKYDTWDRNGDGKIAFDEGMHRTISSVVIVNDLLFCPDFSGLLHCLDARTGRRHWTCDLLAAVWSTPLVADGRLFVADEDGDVAIFRLSADPTVAGSIAKVEPTSGNLVTELSPRQEINMTNSIYSNPVAANGVLYITTKDRLFAIQSSAE